MSRTSAVHATSSSTTAANGSNRKLKGVRRRKWGKYVSEIRVPGTQERLWLGTYATAEAAAVAHDVAVYCLKRPSSLEKLNFPNTLSSYSSSILNHGDLSPRSVQKVASDVAMDVDARNINAAAATTPAATAEAEAAGACNVGSGGDAGDSGVSWWDGMGDDCGGNFHGSSDQHCGEGDQALSISIEDYL